MLERQKPFEPVEMVFHEEMDLRDPIATGKHGQQAHGNDFGQIVHRSASGPGPSAFSVQVSTSSTGFRKTFSKIKVVHEVTKRACPPKRPFAPRMRKDPGPRILDGF